MANDPRKVHDTYTLFVWPTKGPLVGVKLDMRRVRAASASNPNDSSGAEADEVIRQLRADQRLAGLNLNANRALLIHMLQFWTRTLRVEGMTYPAPGTIPDATEEVNRRIKEITSIWQAKLDAQATQAKEDLSKQLGDTEKEYQRRLNSIHDRYQHLQVNLDALIDEAQRQIAAAAERQAAAETRLRAAANAPSASSEDLNAAAKENEQLSQQLRTLLQKFRSQQRDLATASAELAKQRQRDAHAERAQPQAAEPAAPIYDDPSERKNPRLS